jgi:hypothetical protein
MTGEENHREEQGSVCFGREKNVQDQRFEMTF